MRRRGITPTPILYLALAVAGLLIGVIQELLVGGWWWLPPAALLIGAWLFFLSSAWWHRPGSRPISLRIELLEVINPEKGHRARRQAEHDLILASGIPLFEIEGWPGTASLGGWGSSGTSISHVTLAFADQPKSPPTVTVGTVVDEESSVDRIRAHLIGELTGLLLQDEQFSAADPTEVHEIHRRIVDRVHTLPWAATTVQLDDENRSGWRLDVDTHSSAYTPLDGFCVTITGPRGASFSLRTVTQPNRYLDSMDVT